MKKIIFYFIFFIFLLLLIFTMRYYTFKLFPSVDPGVFMYVGELITENNIPYKDVWDHKPPMIYFLNAFLFKFLPKESKTIAVFECFWIFITAIIIFLFSKLIFNSKTSFYTTILFVIVVSNLSFTKSYGKTETYQLLPAVISIFFLFLSFKKIRSSLLFFSGIFASLSFLFKQTGIFILLPLILGIFYYYRNYNLIYKLKCFLFFFLGFSIPLLLIFTYFFIKNSFSDFISQVFLYNFSYIQIINKPMLINITNSYLFKRPILLICAISGLIIFTSNLISKKENNTYYTTGFIILIWLFAELLSLSASKRYYPNYFIQLLPPLIFLSGFLFKTFITKSNFFIQLVSVLIIFIISGATSNMEYSLRFDMKNKNYIKINNNNYTGPDYETINWIFNNTQETDKIYFWGSDARINFVTKRKSPTKYIYIYPLINYKYATKKDFDIFYNDFIKNKPKFIVDSIGFFENNVDSEAAKRFMRRLSEFGFDNAISVYFVDILNFIDKNYYFYDKINEWKVFKLKN